jgi:IS605 OrfB family transposase
VVVSYTGYDKHVALIEGGARIGTAKLWYDQSKKRFYLLVSLEVEVAEPTPESHQHLVGVDVGQRYLAVVATLDNGVSFHSGKEVRAKADHLARTRKRLQRKGTRNATRRLIGIARRERRLKQDCNHALSKQIVERYPHALLGLEELTGIRERTRRKRGKRATKKQRKANRHASKWAFAELHALLAYKAELSGSMAIKVEADYTSQSCPRCGYTDRRNRPDKGLLFVCRNCHFTLHADLIGARNVALRTLLVRQDWTSTGVLSVRPGSSDPDTSGREAKAARLARYAELRWSPDASPRL